MALKTYSLPSFVGINQYGSENTLSQSYTTDAVNIDTTNGRLAVAKGFTKYIPIAIPGTAAVDHLTSYKTANTELTVAITDSKVYCFKNGAWQLIYTYTGDKVSNKYDSQMVRINTTDYLVIANGINQLIKFDGTSVTPFGSEENCSNAAVSYLTMYRGRLFAAGDADNPDRLYYSVLPGGGRTVENWGYIEASPAVEGGHAEVGSVGGDPIVAIHALSNQLLIFKKNSLYRLIGDRPTNYSIERIDACFKPPVRSGIATYADVMYFVTRDGLYYYNGVTARPSADMYAIRSIMQAASVNTSRAIIANDRLFFTISIRGEKKLIVYDLIEKKYMLREGFGLYDMANIASTMMIVSDDRYVCVFDRGNSYDGKPISAYWKTPLTDFGEKSSIKSLHELFLRAKGDKIIITTAVDGIESVYTCDLTDRDDKVIEIPLKDEGRLIQLKFSNEGGGTFEIADGVEVLLGLRQRSY